MRFGLPAALAGLLLFCAGVASTAEADIGAPAEWDKPRQEFLDAWRERMEVVAMGDNLGEKELKKIIALKKRYSLEALPTFSVALLREMNAPENRASDRNAERLATAEELSPGLPVLLLASCSFGSTPTPLLESVQRCAQGWWSDWNSPLGRFRMLSNAFLDAWWAFSLLAFVFAMVVAAKYSLPLAHLVSHRIRGLSIYGGILLFLAIVALSWVAVGWIGPAACFTWAFWRHLSISERVLAGALWLATATLPAALFLPAMHLNATEGIHRWLIEPVDALDFGRRARELRAWVDRTPGDAQALFALAEVEKKAGRTGPAEALLEKVIALRPNWHKPLVNLAHLDYAAGRVTSATTRLKRAAALTPSAFLPPYNLSQIYFGDTQLEEGRIESKRAQNLDAAAFDRSEQERKSSLNQVFLADEPLAPAEIETRLWAISPQTKALRNQLFRSISPVLSLQAYLAAVLGILLLASLSSLLGRVRRPLRVCEKCGQPSCGLCDPAVEREALCSQCYHIFVRLEAIDPAARVAKDRAVKRYRIWREFRARWVTLLVPGTHNLFNGDALRGGAVVFFAGMFGLALLRQSAFFPSPFEGAAIAIFPIGALAAVGYGLVFLVALLGALRN